LDRKYQKVILLIALVIALIGASTFILWPEEKATLSPAASLDQAPIRPASQSNHQAAIIIDAPSPDKQKLSDDVIAVPKTEPASTLEPFDRGATPVPSTPLPTPLIPTVEDRAVWRIETDDFILTVERPNPEGQTTDPLQPQPSKGINEKVHIVVPGDTLWHIAQRYLGDPFRYPELAALSRIKNPDLIYPDDIVRIKIKQDPDNEP
jgi:nucleoid-associated protein YgaU